MNHASHELFVKAIRCVLKKTDRLSSHPRWNKFLDLAEFDGSKPVCPIVSDTFALLNLFNSGKLPLAAFLLALAALVCDEPE